MIWMKPLLHALTNAEPFLNLIALLIVLRSNSWKRFPAVTFYLGFRCFTDAALYFVIEERHFFNVSISAQTYTYVYGYWICFIIGAVAVFFALQEIFKVAMEPVPGLQRLGLIAFRWACIVTVVILFTTTILPIHRYANEDLFLAALGDTLLRSVSILEICLLAFLALSIHGLGRTFRGRAFGLGLGFGIEAVGELICSLMLTKPQSIWCLGNLFLMVAGVSALGIWMVYFLLPETAEDTQPVTLPVTSPLLRWNAIASALGQKPAHVALGTASSSFFLQDVERVVDKFMAKSE